ncbi:MAG: polyprenyl synthetase family protein, partial [Clostridia bacterium]|nr:polyprenyl synthetase family protein [Clostridia bacterium]
GMIGGQTIDIENEGKKIPVKLLNELHALKTGALIRASFAAGAILAGASDEDVQRLSKFGSMTGLAFQIKDDILDAYSDEETLGKPIGSDVKNKKTTYLTHFSLEECEQIIAELSEKCDEISSAYGEKGDFLKGLTKFLLKRNK